MISLSQVWDLNDKFESSMRPKYEISLSQVWDLNDKFESSMRPKW